MTVVVPSKLVTATAFCWHRSRGPPAPAVADTVTPATKEHPAGIVATQVGFPKSPKTGPFVSIATSCAHPPGWTKIGVIPHWEFCLLLYSKQVLVSPVNAIE